MYESNPKLDNESHDDHHRHHYGCGCGYYYCNDEAFVIFFLQEFFFYVPKEREIFLLLCGVRKAGSVCEYDPWHALSHGFAGWRIVLLAAL